MRQRDILLQQRQSTMMRFVKGKLYKYDKFLNKQFFTLHPFFPTFSHEFPDTFVWETNGNASIQIS